MGKECGAWVSRRLWRGGNTSLLKTTAWEAKHQPAGWKIAGSSPGQTTNQVLIKITGQV